MDFDELKRIALDTDPPGWVKELADSLIVVGPDAMEVCISLDEDEQEPLFYAARFAESTDALADDSRSELARIIHLGVITDRQVRGNMDRR